MQVSLPFVSHLFGSTLSARTAQCRERNSAQCSSVKSIPITVTICFVASLKNKIKNKKREISPVLIFFFSPCSLSPPQGLSLCLCVSPGVLGVKCQALYRAVKEENRLRWLMTAKPEIQTSAANASFTKKLGQPTVAIFKVSSHTITPTALGF